MVEVWPTEKNGVARSLAIAEFVVCLKFAVSYLSVTAAVTMPDLAAAYLLSMSQ